MSTTADASPIASSDFPENLSKVVDRLFFLGAADAASRFHMKLVWTALCALICVDFIWLSRSRLHFAASNWEEITRLLGWVVAGLMITQWVAARLQDDPSRPAKLLRAIADRLTITAGGVLLFSLVTSLVVVFCCLATSAALPLRDAELARLDAAIGFDWPAFLAAANASPLASWLLVKAYQSTAYMLCGTVLWLGLSGQGARLYEFLALLCLTSLGVAVGMLLVPAEGAYAYYKPAAEAFNQFSHDAGMWHHDLLMMFRNADVPVIDFSTPNINCLVTFPSGHTILAIVITYALRESLWTLIPSAIVNGTMIVSTLPEGGHHLMDLFGGMAIAAIAIIIVRRRQTAASSRQNPVDHLHKVGFAERLA